MSPEEVFDKAVKREAMFAKVDYGNKEEDQNVEALLAHVLLLIKKGKTLKFIKNYIEKYKLTLAFREFFEYILTTQFKHIAKQQKLNLASQSMLGLSFLELLKERENTVRKQMRASAVELQNLEKEKIAAREFVRRTLKKTSEQSAAFVEMQAQRARQLAYAEEDKKLKIKGWQSVAVLDRRTSVLCASLHGVFYSKKDYNSRLDLPNQIPRHPPKCRSQFITIEEGVDEKEVLKQDLDSFLRRNPAPGREIMGQKKYDLFVSSNRKIKNFIDADDNKFYTNKEILAKLNKN